MPPQRSSGRRLQTPNVAAISNQHLRTTATALTARSTTADFPHGHFEYRPHFDLISGTSAILPVREDVTDRVYLGVTPNKQQAPVGPRSSDETYRYRQETNTHSMSAHITPATVNNIANRQRHFVSIPNHFVSQSSTNNCQQYCKQIATFCVHSEPFC